MPQSDEPKYPPVIAVNHQHKGASSGTWHSFPDQPGEKYISLEFLMNSVGVLAPGGAEAIRAWANTRGWTL